MNIHEFMKRLSVTYAAGAFGGLIYSVAAWAAGAYEITTRMHINLHPEFDLNWLYPHLVWGGIFGWLFIFPFAKNRMFLERALLFSLVPAAVEFLYVLPILGHRGFFGFQLGALTPLFIGVLCFIWGAATSIWLKLLG